MQINILSIPTVVAESQKLFFKSMVVWNESGRWELDWRWGSFKCALRLRYNTFDSRICAQ